jgi:hypothetical protein
MAKGKRCASNKNDYFGFLFFAAAAPKNAAPFAVFVDEPGLINIVLLFQ